MKTAIKNHLNFFIASSFFVLSMPQSGVALAADTLSAEQIRALIVGKTASIFNVDKGVDVQAYFSADGKIAGQNLTKKKQIQGTWEITGDGMLCTESNLAARTCGVFVANGDGTYKRMVNGEHAQTYSAFADSNPKGY